MKCEGLLPGDDLQCRGAGVSILAQAAFPSVAIALRAGNGQAGKPSLPAIAEQRPYSYERHGVTIEDPWHWLRDPKYPEVDDPDVLAYLKAENAYFDGWKAQHQALIDQLFEEMKGRIKEDESSVPIRDGDWLYWWAFKPGAQYRTWYRRPVAGGDEAADLRRTGRSRGKRIFPPGALEVSPDGKLLATLADYDGSERFELRIRDLATGKDVETVTRVGIGQPVWTSDSAGIVFTEVNDHWRSYRARYHRLGTPRPRTSRSTKRLKNSASRSASAIPKTAARSSSRPATMRRARSASCPPTILRSR